MISDNPMDISLQYSDNVSPKCRKIIVSQRAYLSIISEALAWDPLETGGVLFGQYQKDTWYVVEATSAGPKAIHLPSHSEMDAEYYNYLYTVLARLYQCDLSLLGLWHRHPGSFYHFSFDDNTTNRLFAEVIENGTLSFLVNFDPRERLTSYYLDEKGIYHKPEVFIGDQYFEQTNYLKLTTTDALWRKKKQLQIDIENNGGENETSNDLSFENSQACCK